MSNMFDRAPGDYIELKTGGSISCQWKNSIFLQFQLVCIEQECPVAPFILNTF